MVEVKHITKKYDAHIAVDDISFCMERGRIYGLLGPNGAGKSTTMNIMTGYIAPTGGEVLIDEYDIYEDAVAAKRRLGYLPENPPLYQDMTVHEYLMFVAELKGIKKRKERYLAVESVMEDTGVLDVANRLIRTLSKGYKQRVGFAGAIVNDPEVIILDEPTVGLDPKQIIEFRELIRQLGKEHIVLISSHILSEISEVCDHVFIINGGKLIVDDAVENLDRYAGGGSRIHITIKGDANAAKEGLVSLPGVKQVLVQGGDSLVVEVENATEDMTEQISLALMDHKVPILGMTEEKDSLEQIFLEVTEKDEPLAMDAKPDGDEAAETTDEGIQAEGFVESAKLEEDSADGDIKGDDDKSDDGESGDDEDDDEDDVTEALDAEGDKAADMPEVISWDDAQKEEENK